MRAELKSSMLTARSAIGRFLRFVIPAILVAMLAACSGGGGTEVGNPGMSSSFSSDGELEKYLKDGLASSVLPASEVDGALQAVAAAEAPGQDSGLDGSSAESGYSETNLQEAGVDEADKVKTDGIHIYVARGETVAIVRAGAVANLVSQVKAPGVVTSLYLYGDTLVALYNPVGGDGYPWPGGIGLPEPTLRVGMPYWLPVEVKTGLLVVDIADRVAPKVTADWIFDGNLVSSRRIGNQLHLVQQFWPDLPPLQQNFDGNKENYAAVVASNRAELDDIPLEDLLPMYEQRDGNGQLVSSGRVVATEDFLAPQASEGGSIISLVSLDLDQPEQPFNSIGAILDAHLVYASQSSLYLAAQGYAGLFDGRDETVSVHKFDLSQPAVSYVASGSVPGWVLNQFSFGEADDVLRVATTTGLSWGGTWSNNVYCLQANGTDLAVIGRLEGLAPGEKIYASRFIGERGFLVTFKRIDPLLTLDLADPRNPKVVGELKVPGYSDYIHPLDENHLLTIGKDTSLSGETVYYQGLQLSIFDVSNFAKPTLLHSVKIGDRGTESEALQDHKAFSFWSERNLLALPVTLLEFTTPPEAPWSYGEFSFRGVYVYRVTPENGFDLRGRVDTTLGGSVPTFPVPWARGVFIGDDIHAITPEVVRSAVVEQISTTTNELILP